MTDKLPVHSVIVSREDDLWVAVVEGLPAGATDTERFEDLPEAVRDLISTLLGVEPDSFWIDWHYRQGDHDLTDLIEHLREWEDLAERAARSRDAIRRTAVESMRSAGLSYREIADVVGISHQRVGQLLSESDTGAPVRDRGVTPMVQAKWTRELVMILDGTVEGQPTPYEAVLIALLDSARRIRPDSRRDLLSATASVLEDAATDKEFLRSH